MACIFVGKPCSVSHWGLASDPTDSGGRGLAEGAKSSALFFLVENHKKQLKLLQKHEKKSPRFSSFAFTAFTSGHLGFDPQASLVLWRMGPWHFASRLSNQWLEDGQVSTISQFSPGPHCGWTASPWDTVVSCLSCHKLWDFGQAISPYMCAKRVAWGVRTAFVWAMLLHQHGSEPGNSPKHRWNTR